MYLDKFVRDLYTKIDAAITARRIKLRTLWLVFRVEMMWKNKMRRNAKDRIKF